MCRKLSIIFLLCVAMLFPSIASAQESIWSRQKIAIASISDRTERGLDENYKRSIYAKIRDVLVTNFDTFEVNIDDVKNQLRASNLPPSPQNIRKKIGERGADFIVFTEIRATSSAYDAYNANAQIIIILSQHRIVTGKEVSRTITVSPNQSAVTGGVGQLISELFGVSTSGQSVSQNTYGSQPAQQSARTQTIKIGDVLYNDGRAGIVFSVDTSMQQGLIVSVDESQLIIENAKYWCEELGKSWRLPSVDELELIYRNVDVINASLERNGYSTRIYKEDYYWSNLVSDGWICVSMNDGVGYRDLGDSFNRVRAVSAFSLNSHNNSSSSTHQYSSYNQSQSSYSQTYKVGDYYDANGKQGVVFAVTPDGKHGKIVGLNNLGNMTWNSAVSACRNLGNGWRLPSEDELLAIYKVKSTLDSTLAAVGDGLPEGYHWSSIEGGSDYAWRVHMFSGTTYYDPKNYYYYVRAVSAF